MLAADAELVKDRLFSAFNLIYEPEKVRPRGEAWEKESTFGIFTALMAQVTENVFFGGELRYLRKYDGLALDDFVGHALFLGPVLFVKLPGSTSLMLAWSAQVAGHAVGDPRSLDLKNFERHEAKAKFSKHF